MAEEQTDLSPGWAVETAAIWAQFPERKGVLDLTNRTMSQLPEELFRMRKLTSLTVNNCKLGKISGAWDGLGELKIVKADSNELKEVDEDLLFSCGNTLEVLSFAGNVISKFPKKLSSAMFLTELDLSNNEIVEIPKDVVNLGQLTTLRLGGNKIKSLPSNFHEMRKIEVLDISNNALESIPLLMGLCSSITEFSCAGNPFSKMPELQGLDGRVPVFQVLRKGLRQKQETRALLFDERDSRNNVRFEINEELDPKHPIMTAATLEKLIKFLTPAIPPDQPTFKAFLTCYTYFTNPHDILELMYIRFKTNFDKISSFGEDTQQTMKLVQLRVFAGLMKFVSKFNADGLKFDDETVELLKSFAKLLSKAGQEAGATQLEKTIEANKECRGRASSKFDDEVAKTTLVDKKKKKAKEGRKKRGSGLFDTLRRAKAKKDYEEAKSSSTEALLTVPAAFPPPVVGAEANGEDAPSLVPTLKVVPKLDFLQAEPSDIAGQLALRMNDLLGQIDVNEFLHQAWAKAGAQFAAPNILQFIDFFNRVSQWIATLIVMEKNMAQRVKILSHALDVAQESLDLGDFSSAYSIASALMSSPVSRLKQTWQCIDEKRIQINGALNKLSDNSGNYRSYRSLLQQKASTRVIPYLGLLLTDLTFTEENANFIDDSDLINFAKFRIIHRVLDAITTYQSHSYKDIPEKPEVMNMIECSDRIEDEDTMYNESLGCEASRRQTISHDPAVRAPASGGGRSRRNSLPYSDPALPSEGGAISGSISMMEMHTHTEDV